MNILGEAWVIHLNVRVRLVHQSTYSWLEEVRVVSSTDDVTLDQATGCSISSGTFWDTFMYCGYGVKIHQPRWLALHNERERVVC